MPIEDPILVELRGINTKLGKLIELFDDSDLEFVDEDEDEGEDDTVGDEEVPTPKPLPGMQPVPHMRLVK